MAFVLAGLVVGAALGWLWAQSRVKQGWVSKTLHDELKTVNATKEQEIRELTASLAKAEQWSEDLRVKLAEQKKEVGDLQEHFRLEMRELSRQLLDEKSKKFLELNDRRMSEILNPLKERIQQFEEKVERNSKDHLEWNTALREQVKGLAEANVRMAEDARRLTSALKGDKKLQGNWGELQLEMILQKAGLEQDIHYRKEVVLKSMDGSSLRPDYVIHLPDHKHLVIDSKVSLVAYETYFNEEDPTVRQAALSDHIAAMQRHIQQLGGKNYQNLQGINPPDYVMLFVPIEPALNLALRENPALFEKALGQNIVLVSTSTLLATLRTISHIWKQENQRKNVVEIARESGALYDKFVLFMEDLTGLGKKLDGVQKDYTAAMNKLYESPQKGGTIVGRIERIRKLGADTSKQLPQSLLDRTDDPEE